MTLHLNYTEHNITSYAEFLIFTCRTECRDAIQARAFKPAVYLNFFGVNLLKDGPFH